MSDTEAELRKRHLAETNETPEIGEETDEGETDVAGTLPTPTLSRDQLLVIAVIIAIIAVIVMYRSRAPDGTGGGSLDEARGDALEPEATIEDDKDDEITVPKEESNPLAADQAVTEAFRDRELLSGED